ncbi:MAG: cation-translocating P-type ATPase [Chloroflexi bacterium]|nr:cation-translocating P-type ATPase [Chloroflexota bacterium]
MNITHSSPAERRNFYSQPVHETVRQLDVHLHHGLSVQDVMERRLRFGYNELPAAGKVPLWRKFAAQFADFIVLLLAAAALVSLLLGDLIEAAAILAIVVLNAVIGLVQEQRADAALDELRRLASPNAWVLRDGTRVTVPARELVPGDVIFLEAGNFVPADAQLVEGVNLQVDESALTGESAPVLKCAEEILEPDIPIADRINMAYSGTLITRGRATGVVTATALRTEIGMIARMMSEIEVEQTPLQQRLNQLGRTLSMIALLLCALVFIVLVMRETDLQILRSAGFVAYLSSQGVVLNDAFILAVSLAVAAVPEGLAAIVTINLAIGMREMVRRHALVRRLSAVETLGSTTVICSDKTGTLTQNAMTVVEILAGGRSYHVTGRRYDPFGEFIVDDVAVDAAAAAQAPLREMLRAALCCSDALLEHRDDQVHMVGDPTEGALVVAAAKAGLTREMVDVQLPRLQEIPFDAVRRRMTTLHRNVASGDGLVFVKGASDVLLELCTHCVGLHGAVPMTAALHAEISAVAVGMAERALRVLAVAARSTVMLPEDDVAFAVEPDSAIEDGLIFLGLFGMQDPPRPEAALAIRTARVAGVRTVMITGDNPVTARAIAGQIGLLDEGARTVDVVVGAEIEQMSEDELCARVRTASVFARVSPEHKLRLVGAFKRLGHIVAMTGDGINDAPALKRADIGVAMGITGADVSKEVADIVLTDDNFASIVGAVAQGRVIYANIRKFVSYLLGCNIAEIGVILIATLLGWHSPLNAIQLLWLNLMTDGAPALALGLERSEPDVMQQPPRPPREPIINRRMTVNLAVQSSSLAIVVLGVYAIGRAYFPASAATMAFLALALSELPLAYTSRSERFTLRSIGVFGNRFMQWAVLTSLLGVLAVVYVPFLNNVFATTPLNWAELAVVVPAAFLPALAVELLKWLVLRQVIRPAAA